MAAIAPSGENWGWVTEKSQQKRRNKEQEVAFENTDVKGSKEHTLTEGSLLLL